MFSWFEKKRRHHKRWSASSSRLLANNFAIFFWPGSKFVMTVDAAKLDTKVFVSKIGHSLGCQDLRVKVLKQEKKTL